VSTKATNLVAFLLGEGVLKGAKTINVMIAHKIAYNFTAILSLLPTKEGGRKKPVMNHYRPSFSFGSKQHFSGEIVFIDADEIAT